MAVDPFTLTKPVMPYVDWTQFPGYQVGVGSPPDTWSSGQYWTPDNFQPVAGYGTTWSNFGQALDGSPIQQQRPQPQPQQQAFGSQYIMTGGGGPKNDRQPQQQPQQPASNQTPGWATNLQASINSLGNSIGGLGGLGGFSNFSGDSSPVYHPNQPQPQQGWGLFKSTF